MELLHPNDYREKFNKGYRFILVKSVNFSKFRWIFPSKSEKLKQQILPLELKSFLKDQKDHQIYLKLMMGLMRNQKEFVNNFLVIF